ncbi:hypothetical protein [Streptomyces boluensis]|uniref:Uncharacterized protein n=1 Tax=Streptomyces boluensis TaxID=1775135 RepID=A0A964XLJ0_9ACTN|nr:hypothetical protein [Streptomyces boluensis]NBE53514.1 hypothetical protein [Streptomyces boluensis]
MTSPHGPAPHGPARDAAFILLPPAGKNRVPYPACSFVAVALIMYGSSWGNDAGVSIAFAGLGVMVCGGVAYVVEDFRRAARSTHMRVDATGVWLRNKSGMAVIPWHSLAAVGLHWAKKRGLPTYTLELCPAVAVDPGDHVLGPWVRDDEPFRPGLPRLRYRIALDKPTRSRVKIHAAVQRYAPHLWSGLTERERGYDT